ncbi:MAG: hypothetical protein ACI4OY_03330 [Aristaeellaceae bacterium]
MYGATVRVPHLAWISMKGEAGPVRHLSGVLSLCRVRDEGIHMVGTAGSIPQDLEDILRLPENDPINAGAMRMPSARSSARGTKIWRRPPSGKPAARA